MSRLAAPLLAVLTFATAAHAQAPEILREVRVHGNHTTPDADILSLAGLVVGNPVTDAVLHDATERLRQSGRFDSVDVRKRFQSIENPSDILIIVMVNEVAGISVDDLTPGPLKKLRSTGMWLPIVDYADGYGFTYGARVSFVNALGPRSRISVPFTWGGERRAAVEVDRSFRAGPLSRIEGGASVTRRVNPHFDVSDTRKEVRARAERAITSWLRLGGGARLTNVSFAGLDTTYVAPGLDVVVDTRTDPGFPRNAIHATAGIEQLRFEDSIDVARATTDVRGYIGLIGSSVLALRATNIVASDPLPPFEQPLLGGTQTLRGFDFGYRAGDNLSAMSAEVRVPITSPIAMGRFGVKGFIDAGTVYPSGAKLTEQTFDRGVGGGAFMSWAVIRMGLDVAWPVTGDEHKPRWHFGLGITF